jgi:hypothetical protein
MQPRAALMTVNGNPSWIFFPNAGDWAANTTNQGVATPVYLSPGTTTISFSNPGGWAPDIVGITIQPLGRAAPVTYKVVGVQSGRVLADAFASMAAGMPVIQWPAAGGSNEEWQLSPQGDGSYRVINRFSGQALDAFERSAQPGAPLVQWPSSGDPIQRWRPVSAGNGSFVLINQSNGLLVHASSDWGGAKVDQWISTGAADEQWILMPVM